MDTELSVKLILDLEDKDEKLIPDVEKTLADNFIERIKLHFKSLAFQNIDKFYEIKNIGGLK